jgi:hypothetical protein
MQQALENALGDLILGAPLDADDAAGVRAWLARNQVAPADREAILQTGVERLLVYRRLVRNGLRGALQVSIPRTLSRLGTLSDEYFDRFLRERAPRTHYLRDVPREFLWFCAPLWAEDARVPAYALDLANHEFLRIEIGAMPVGEPPQDLPSLDLDRGLCFIETARVVHYSFRVHELSDDENDRTEPAAGRTDLFVYRSREHVVRYLELTPLAAGVIERLVLGATLRQALTEATAEHGRALDEAVVTGTARVLSDLAERGALVGASGTE